MLRSALYSGWRVGLPTVRPVFDSPSLQKFLQCLFSACRLSNVAFRPALPILIFSYKNWGMTGKMWARNSSHTFIKHFLGIADPPLFTRRNVLILMSYEWPRCQLVHRCLPCKYHHTTNITSIWCTAIIFHMIQHVSQRFFVRLRYWMYKLYETAI